jgi:hypothetical protein
MTLFLSKRKSPSMSWEDRNSDSMVEKLQRVESDSDCASDFKRITISREYHSGKHYEIKQGEISSQDDSQSLRTGDTELKSSASWNSVSTNSISQGSNGARVVPLTRSLSPQSILTSNPQKGEGDFFVKRAIRHLQCWMPGSIRSQSILDMEISRANQRIASSDLPGNLVFIPVHSSCPMLPIFDYCDIDPIAVSLGASYFQRLLNKKPTMMNAAQEAGWFVEVVNDVTGEVQTQMRAVYSSAHTGLVVIYATCIYIAAKFADRIKYKRLLSALLFSMLDSYVSEETAVDLEAKCLAKLEWRLGLRADVP